MHKTAFYIINGITLYRLLAAFLLFYLIYTRQQDLFKWLLPVSFLTDLIDGVLARKYHVTSISGAFLDSIGDDLTIIAGLAGMYFFRQDFMVEHSLILFTLFGLFLLQIAASLIRYGKISSFHTILAKIAAILQGTFMILLFLLPAPVHFLFYAAAALTFLDLIEELILVMLLPEWTVNVKGLYWLFKKSDT